MLIRLRSGSSRTVIDSNAAKGVVPSFATADRGSCGSCNREPDRYKHPLLVRVGGNRMGADSSRCIRGEELRGRSSVRNAEHTSSRASDIVLITGGTVPDFVGAALTLQGRNHCSMRINDQRVRAAAPKHHLVGWAERKTLRAGTAR